MPNPHIDDPMLAFSRFLAVVAVIASFVAAGFAGGALLSRPSGDGNFTLPG